MKHSNSLSFHKEKGRQKKGENGRKGKKKSECGKKAEKERKRYVAPTVPVWWEGGDE